MPAKGMKLGVLAVLAALLLAGCAAKPRYQTIPKCYVADSTKHFSREQMEEMFRGVATNGKPFVACPVDTSDISKDAGEIDSAWARVRVVDSDVPRSKNSSWAPLALNLALDGAAAGLAGGLNHAGWLWLSLFSFEPRAQAEYRVDYLDAKGKKQHFDVRATTDPWFREPDTLRREVLESSQRALASQLFDTVIAVRDPRRHRIGLEPLPLIFYKRRDALQLTVHYERLLPHSFSVEGAVGGWVPFEDDMRAYWAWVGPRWYPQGEHGGFYIGFATVGETGRHAYSNAPGSFTAGIVGLPFVVGWMTQHWRFYWDANLYFGPAYRFYGANLAGNESGPSSVVFGNLVFGYRF